MGARHLPTNSLRRGLAVGASWSLAGAVGSRGFVLVSNIVLARLLGKSMFGMFGIVLMTVVVFCQFASFGVSLTATKHLAELKETDPKRAGVVLSLVLLTGAFSVVLFGGGLLLVADWLASDVYNVDALTVPLMLGSGVLIANFATLMFQGALAGFEDFRTIAHSNVVQGILQLSLTVPLAYKFGIEGAVVGLAMAWAASAVWCIVMILRHCKRTGVRLGLRGVWGERRILWRYSVPSMLTGMATGPAMIVGRSTMSGLPDGTAGLGGFQAAGNWRNVVLFIPRAVRRVTLPMLSRFKGADDPRRYLRALLANVALNGGVALVVSVPLILLSPFIM